MSIRQIIKKGVVQPAKWLARPIVRPLRDLFLLPAIQQFKDLGQQLQAQLQELSDSVKMTDRTLLGMGFLSNLASRDTNRLPSFPKVLYADLRCLQDPFYSKRGIGFHASGVLRHVRQFLSPSLRVIGLTDLQLPDLPEEYCTLVDEVRAYRLAEPLSGILIHLSPMTHDPAWLAPLFARNDLLHVALVYDFIPLDETARYLASANAHRSYLNCLIWLKACDIFCPISELAGRRLQELLGIPSERIAVTGACIRSDFLNATKVDPGNLPFEKENYFLVVGGGDSRKNVEIVLQAHAEVPGKTGLVIAGHYEDEHSERLREQYRSFGGTVKRLKFARGLSDAELAALYRNALATIVPSKNEGFSLPVVEALCCDCPVILSDIPVHRELVKWDASFFGTSDLPTLKDKLVKFQESSDIRNSWLSGQKTMPLDFSEPQVSQKVWSQVLRFLPEHSSVEVGIPQLRTAKPKIAFLTPLPPERSGVADYSADCLRSLVKYAEVDVYTNHANCVRDPGVHRYELICDLPYINGKYDRVVSVIANSTEYNRKCIDLLKRYGGPCISHDARMIDYYMALHGRFGFAELASQWLKRPVSFEEGWEWYIEQSKMQTLCFEQILPKAAPMIVHSRGIQKAIEKQYGVTPAVVPFSPYRHFQEKDLSPHTKAEARNRLGLDPKRLIIVSLGIVAKEKAPIPCLDALQILREQGLDAELYFVGTNGGIAEFWSEWIAERGLRGHAHFLNRWIDEQTYRDYCLAGDLALQLRTHRFGGISGALADCISAGLPTVANLDLADALDSPDYVFRVSDELVPADIAARLTQAQSSLAQVSDRLEIRRKYLEERNFDSYSKNLLQVLGL